MPRSFLPPFRSSSLFGVLLIALVSQLTSVGQALAGENIWTWFPGIPGSQFIISSATDTRWIYLRASNPERLYRSDNGGQSWTEATLPAGVTILEIMLAPYHAERIVAATFDNANGDAPVFVSHDAGDSWRRTALTSQVVAISYVDPDEMYATDRELFRTSPDSGQTWATTGVIPESCSCTTEFDCVPYYVEDIVVAPSTPNTIVIRLYAGNASNYKLCRSQDRGATWSVLSLPFDSTHSLAIDPRHGNTMYAGAPGGGWKTVDGGETWRPMANGLTDPTSFQIDPNNTQNLYALNDNTVWESIDGGASWQKLDAGIPGLQVLNLAVTRYSGLRLYAQSLSSGLWSLERTTAQSFLASINNGDLFTKTPDVTLTLSAPAGTTQMQISNDGGFVGAAWEAYTTNKAWTITSVGETPMPRTVYVRFRTNGQISGLYLDDIVLDRVGPRGAIEVVDPLASPGVHGLTAGLGSNSAAGYSLRLPSVTVRYLAGMRAVTLRLTAADDVSGVGDMLIGLQPDLRDGKLLGFSDTAEWYVPDQGGSTVYVSFVDRAGNASPIYAATTSAP